MNNERGGQGSSRAVYEYIKTKRDALEKEFGNRLPTEEELSALLGTDRFSVRRALRKLVENGLLHSVRNRGYFFELECDQVPVGGESNYHRFCEAKRLPPRAEIVDLSVDTPRGAIAEALALAPREEAWNILFLRYRDSLRFSLTRSWIPRKRTPGLIAHIRKDRSLYRTLAGVYGIQATRVRTVCSAVNAATEEARLLDLPLSSALLKSASTAVDQEGAPIEYCETLFRGDVVKLEFNFPRTPR